jgi:GntR family transcriptional regulator, transcriptional repressor for pyruvate dehydrogenase complex
MGSRTALPRHQTLRAAVDWSWDLLDDTKQALLRRLSTFTGATLEAAEQVCAIRPVAVDDVHDLLTVLADKSLLTVRQTQDGPRYRLLETIRGIRQGTARRGGRGAAPAGPGRCRDRWPGCRPVPDPAAKPAKPVAHFLISLLQLHRRSERRKETLMWPGKGTPPEPRWELFVAGPQSDAGLTGSSGTPTSRRSKVVDLPGIQPVTPVRISDDVSEQIRRLILSENLDEGARLPSERYLAERFGASRPTVSQALRRLSLMGMVEIRRGSGAYVLRRPQEMVTASVGLMLDLDRRSISDLAQLRLWLETVGVEQAARRTESLSAQHTAQMRDALHRLGETLATTSQWIAADTVFHAAMVGAAGNSYLTAVYESVHTAVLSYEYDEWLKTDAKPGWMRITGAPHLDLHAPILDAVLRGKPALARAAVLSHHEVMLEHITDAGQRRGRARRRVRDKA